MNYTHIFQKKHPKLKICNKIYIAKQLKENEIKTYFRDL